MSAGRPAVFLDRDGVLNANVFFTDTGEWESPRTAADFQLLPRAIEATRRLQDAGFALFVVSNQPNQAKRKSTMADHEAIHALLMAGFAEAGVNIVEAYYCFHHPRSIDPALSGGCDCRKPLPFFLFQARDRHGVDLPCSWMVGDRVTDVECGVAAGVRTIFIGELDDVPPGAVARAADMWQASQTILGSAPG